VSGWKVFNFPSGPDQGVDQSYSEIKGHWPESGAQHTKLFACIALIQAAIRRALDHMGNGGAPPRWEREFKGHIRNPVDFLVL